MKNLKTWQNLIRWTRLIMLIMLFIYWIKIGNIIFDYILVMWFMAFNTMMVNNDITSQLSHIKYLKV